MEYSEAMAIAKQKLEMIAPHCERCEIAGSLRRRKSEVKDIEILAIPKPYERGLLESGLASVVNKWEKVKGDMIYGKVKYTQRILPEGIKLDLFFANEDNWGLLYATRTGSADFSYKTLARGWVKQGYRGVDGYLTRDGEIIPVREEEDLFKLIKIPFVNPEDRNH